MADDTSTQDASAEDAVTDDAQGADGGTQEEEQDKPLGPAGEKALAAEKAKRKEAEAKARAARERIAELERGGDEAAKEKAEIEKAAMARANQRLVRAEVKAAAAGVLTDPNDAAQFLDLSSFEVGDDGEVDADEVKAAIADLVKKKPYLAASIQVRRPPWPVSPVWVRRSTCPTTWASSSGSRPRTRPCCRPSAA
jgi:sRNA-binding protein